jgi:hypothetical protein
MKLPSGWEERPPPDGYVDMWIARYGTEVPSPRFFWHRDGRVALLGREPVAMGSKDLRWHISVRHGDPGVDGRVPTWEELVETAHALRPGVPFVIAIPPLSWWINHHPDVLHMFETHDESLVASWRNERGGQKPT